MEPRSAEPDAKRKQAGTQGVMLCDIKLGNNHQPTLPLNTKYTFIPLGMKSEKRTIGERGQIVLPKKLRERFNLGPGKKVIVEEKADAIVLKPVPDPKAFVEEFVSVPKKVKKLTISDIKKVLEEEYEIH